jgi:hypothetical protein
MEVNKTKSERRAELEAAMARGLAWSIDAPAGSLSYTGITPAVRLLPRCLADFLEHR